MMEPQETPKEPYINLAGNEPQDIQRMLEMKKSYDFWQNIMTRKFQDDGKFLPFPKEDKVAGLDMLQALQRDASSRAAQENGDSIPAGISNTPDEGTENGGAPLLNDTELSFLRSRIAEFISFSGFDQTGKDAKLDVSARRNEPEGYSVYGTNDEQGLHENYDEQDDYDIQELEEGDNFLYEYAPTHHIEVELNDGPAGSSNPDEPSCEFTFEYDRNGKLVPTYSNVEEKLRLMSLQSRLAAETVKTEGKKKKKSKNKKKKVPDAAGQVLDETCCLFCQYEAFFGVKPVHMMKWYDQKIMKDEKRRQKIKEKLESAKLKALKRQREMRQRQNEEEEDSDGSRATVVDQGT